MQVFIFYSAAFSIKCSILNYLFFFALLICTPHTVSGTPDSLLYVKAKKEYLSKDYKEAQLILNKINETTSNEDLIRERNLLRGKILYREKDYLAAAKLIESIIKYNTEGLMINDKINYKNNKWLGYIYYSRGNNEKSIKRYKKALNILDIQLRTSLWHMNL